MIRSVRPPRLRALDTLTGVLRGDPCVPVPEQADEWESFLALAAEHDLLPAVWSAWCAAGRRVVPAEVGVGPERSTPLGRLVPEVLLRRAYEANAARVERLLDTWSDVLGLLGSAGVVAVPLKGLHMLLAGVWPDPPARTMVDLDILVPAAAATDAFELLRRGGFDERPEPIGEHADHHLAMLGRGDVTIELHTEPLIARWRAIAPAAGMLASARERPTAFGPLLLASDTDAFVHLVAHAQLQDDTYRRLGMPLRALLETGVMLGRPNDVDLADVERRFAGRGVSHVLRAHLADAHARFGVLPAGPGDARSRAHQVGVAACTASPQAAAAWTYLTYLPESFARDRMVAEFGEAAGTAWLWRSRARHAGRRVAVRLGHDRGGGAR